MRLVCFLLLLVTLPACRGSAPSSPASAASAAPPAALTAPPAAAPPSAPALPARVLTASHQFYGVYVAGQKAGYAEEWIRPLPGGVSELQTTVSLEIQRLGQRLVLSLSDRVRYAPGPEGVITEFETIEDMGAGGKTVRRAKTEGDRFIVTVSTGGSESTETQSVPKERAHDTFTEWMVPRLLATQKPLRLYQYDRSTLKDIAVETRIKSQRSMVIQGVPTTVLEVEGNDTERGLVLGSRLTSAGRALELTVGPGFKLVLEEEAIAKDRSVQVPDLYRLGLVPVDKTLGRPDTVSSLTLALDGLPDAARLDDARQSRKGNEVTVRRVACADVPESALSPEDRVKFLAATPFIDHEAAAVRTLLARAPEGPGREERLTMLVNQSLRYSLATAPLRASAIIEGGSGDCTEYARVLVALLRAAGVPAREISGMAYSGDAEPGFAFHAWAEAYVSGRWCALDPTWGQTTIDATHLALSRDDPTAIVGLLGGVKARVLAVGR